MKYTKKMILVPIQEGGSSDQQQTSTLDYENTSPKEKSGNAIRRYTMERQQKLLSIVMKLALTSGYDSYGRMKDRNGNYIQDISPLLLHALSPGRSLRGMERFVQLLYESGVEPDEIINVNIREMLEGQIRRNIRTNKTSASISKQQPHPSSQTPSRVLPPSPTPTHEDVEELVDSNVILPPPPPLIPMVPPDDPRYLAEEAKRQKEPEMMDVSSNLKRKRNQNEPHEEPSTKKFAWDTLGH